MSRQKERKEFRGTFGQCLVLLMKKGKKCTTFPHLGASLGAKNGEAL